MVPMVMVTSNDATRKACKHIHTFNKITHTPALNASASWTDMLPVERSDGGFEPTERYRSPKTLC